MKRKMALVLLSMFFITLLAIPVYADQSSNTTQPSTNNSTDTSGPFSSLTKESGLQPITPIDLDAAGNKAVNFGNKSYAFLLKGSIPLFVWAVGGSVLILLLGIFFGKKVIMAGVVGILISLGTVVLIHYLPQIAITVKSAAGSALTP